MAMSGVSRFIKRFITLQFHLISILYEMNLIKNRGVYKNFYDKTELFKKYSISS